MLVSIDRGSGLRSCRQVPRYALTVAIGRPGASRTDGSSCIPGNLHRHRCHPAWVSIGKQKWVTSPKRRSELDRAQFEYNLDMRERLLSCLLVTSAFAQTGGLGVFTNSDDVGAPPIKGSAEFDASTGQYRITGSGTDIWGKADQFHYVWREMSGNFAVTATAQFLTEGNEHRKAVIMLRKTLDTDSPFVHLVIHGNGMPGVQFRSAKGDNTNTVDLPIEGPGTFKLRLVRQGTTITVSIAKDGEALRERGHTDNQLGSPVLVGLGVSSHTQTATNTVLFSDVSVEQLAPPAGKKQ